jgi:acetylornithine/N-succinyldiaminopimelate aminotransferase
MTTLDNDSQYFFHTYKRTPITIDHGEGIYLYAEDGTRYLDLFAGLAVNALGYGNPNIINAIEEQIKRYIHLSNYYVAEPQVRLATLLISLSGYRKVFFTNSGTESIEGAMKIARKWGARNKKSEILSFTNSFHGRTMGALSLMDRQKYREGFGPFLDNCTVLGYNNSDALRKAVSDKTSAIVLEFIQGEGGIIPATKQFVDQIRTLQQEFNFLLIADEIQSGLGRTGKLFSFQHYAIEPDIVVVAKPLGGGLPLGAILGNEKVADIFGPGSHGTTFGGNPVACAAGVAMINEIIDGALIENAARMGTLLQDALYTLKQEFPKLITDVRGMGLMVGMELAGEGDPVVSAMREHGILLNSTNGNVIRFLPPLIIHEDAIRVTIAALKTIFNGMATSA